MTVFIPAADLKKKYFVQGRFYSLTNNNNSAKCRSLLTITDRANSNHRKLLVVMLNPGSSRPLADNYNEPTIPIKQIDKLKQVPLVPAKPDTTQYQIMIVMNVLNFSDAQIINLLDIREPKSGILFDNAKIRNIESEASIFSDSRQAELKTYFTTDTTVILAWGNARTISDIEKIAIKRITSLTDKVFMVCDDDKFIRHPSPQNHNLKLKWLDNIIEQLNSSQN